MIFAPPFLRISKLLSNPTAHLPGDRSTFAELLLVSEVSNRYQVLTNEEKHLTMAQCDKLKASGDTHLITGLEFGGQCIISVRVKITNNENRTDVEGELAGSLDIEKVSHKSLLPLGSWLIPHSGALVSLIYSTIRSVIQEPTV